MGTPDSATPQHPRDEAETPDLAAIDRLLAVSHREDDQPCSCDECMSYGAEDAGADWARIPAANRIVMRVLDGADSRLAALLRAFDDHAAADRPTSDAASEPDAGTLSLSLAASVERLRELRAAATPGPWGAEGGIDVFEEGGEYQVNVLGPDGLLATLPTGIFALTEIEYDKDEQARRWAAAIATQATPDAAFIAAAGSLSWDSLAAALTELAGVRAAATTFVDVWPTTERPYWAQRTARALDELRAALSPTPMPPMPPTPSVPTKEGTPDE